MHREDDFGRLLLRAVLVAGLAAELGVVVLHGGHERVGVSRLEAGRRVGLVLEVAVAVPRDLGEGVAAGRGAHQGHGLAEADRLAFDVAGNLGGTRWILKKKINDFFFKMRNPKILASEKTLIKNNVIFFIFIEKNCEIDETPEKKLKYLGFS